MPDQEIVISLSNGYWWISPVAILLSALIAAVGVIYSMARQRAIAKTRATLDVILKSESDEHYTRIYKTFKSEREREGGLAVLLDSKTESDRKCLREVLDFINHYELIAVSINKQILDEDFYKHWMRSSYVEHYDDSRELIEAIREKAGSNTFFEYFEALSSKWREEMEAEKLRNLRNSKKKIVFK